MVTALTGKECGDGKDKMRNVTIDCVPWILGQARTNVFRKVCIVKGDNVIMCGLGEICTEKYCKKVQHYRLFINL